MHLHRQVFVSVLIPSATVRALVPCRQALYCQFVYCAFV